MKTLDMQTAERVQTAVANHAHEGYEDMTPVQERFEAEGFDAAEVAEVVAAAQTELASQYAGTR